MLGTNICIARLGIKTLKKINSLLKDLQGDLFGGEGKPELLRGESSGTWSRHINDKDRLVYENSKWHDSCEIV